MKIRRESKLKKLQAARKRRHSLVVFLVSNYNLLITHHTYVCVIVKLENAEKCLKEQAVNYLRDFDLMSDYRPCRSKKKSLKLC